MNTTTLLKEFLYSRYDVSEFPSLDDQITCWQKSAPLSGVKILDATPVFFNTGLKYLSLLAAGAELTVSAHPELPSDENAVKFFRECGINVVTTGVFDEEFDCICDCAGMHKSVPSRHGIVELTGSGAHAYLNWSAPVFLADGGRVKVLETGLGTGNGLLRALEKLQYPALTDRKVLIFGGGKVGSGVALALGGAGAVCSIVDHPNSVRCKSKSVAVTDINDTDTIRKKISEAWAVVTATGVKNAVASFHNELKNSSAVLINIGVEDEYGSDVPATRVLNAKHPLNFILDEPTLLRYIDPTMALSNLGVIELLNKKCVNGLNYPPEELENRLLELVKSGAAAPDIPKLEEFYYD